MFTKTQIVTDRTCTHRHTYNTRKQNIYTSILLDMEYPPKTRWWTLTGQWLGLVPLCFSLLDIRARVEFTNVHFLALNVRSDKTHYKNQTHRSYNRAYLRMHEANINRPRRRANVAGGQGLICGRAMDRWLERLRGMSVDELDSVDSVESLRAKSVGAGVVVMVTAVWDDERRNVCGSGAGPR